MIETIVLMSELSTMPKYTSTISDFQKLPVARRRSLLAEMLRVVLRLPPQSSAETPVAQSQVTHPEDEQAAQSQDRRSKAKRIPR